MKIAIIFLTIMMISVWLCAATKIRTKRSKEESSQKCTPGTRWKNDCNSCFCTETGIGVCTKKGCLTFDNFQQLNERRKRSISESTRSHNEFDNHRTHHQKNNIDAATERSKNCVPGTRWRNNCNSCWCSDNGLAACTMMACLNNNALPYEQHRQTIRGSTHSSNSILEHSDKHARRRRAIDNNGKCIPGSHWREDCNTCSCSETGFSSCTYKACLHFNNEIKPFISNRRRRSSSTVSSTPSTPGTTTFLDSPPPENEKCKHGTIWMNECNRCRCMRGHSACTRMMCYKEKNIKNN